MSIDPNIFNSPGSIPGVVGALADLDRRVSAMESARTYIGSGTISGGPGGQIVGSSITANEINTGSLSAGSILANFLSTGGLEIGTYPAARIQITTSGIYAFSSGMTEKLGFDIATGALRVAGAITAQSNSAVPVTYVTSGNIVSGTIITIDPGGMLQTAASASPNGRVVLDNAGLRTYNPSGVLTTQIDNLGAQITAGTFTGTTFRSNASVTRTTGTGVYMDDQGLRLLNSNVVKVVLDNNGSASFSGTLSGATGSFSGSLTGSTGTFGGVTLNASGLSASQFSIDSSGNATFSGTLSAASGSFSGNITGGNITGVVIRAVNLAMSQTSTVTGMLLWNDSGNTYVAGAVGNYTISGGNTSAMICNNPSGNGRAEVNVSGFNDGSYGFNNVAVKAWNGVFGMLTKVVYNGNGGSDFAFNTSDKSLKKNIRMMKKGEGMEIVRGLSGRKFIWKDTGQPDYGILAQEVQAVAPDAVTEIEYMEEDPENRGETVKKSRLGVQPLTLIGILVEAVRDMDDRLAAIEKAKK